jgi:hypothetical protein
MRMNAAETNEAGSVDIRVVARIHVFEHSRTKFLQHIMFQQGAMVVEKE